MILCFSGNGNSAMVARLLSSHLGDGVTMLRSDILKNPAGVRFSREKKRIVWVLPVHSWGIPVAVRRFIKALGQETFDEKVVHHLVLTCGDDCGKAHRMWRQLIEAHGWVTKGCHSVRMPNTYTLLPGFDVDSPELARTKLDAAPARVAEVATGIGEGRDTDDVIEGSLPRLKTSVVYPLFERYDIHPSKFRVSERCVSCSLCAQTCPLDNISIVDGRPRWGNDCTQCMGCYNVCPQRAVDYGKRSRGKGQYYNR